MEELIHIIEKCIGQDKNYQRKFYDRYFAFALKQAFRYCTDYERARDVVHDSFIKVFNNLQQFLQSAQNPGTSEFHLMAWIKKIVINTAIDQLRKDKSIPVLVEITGQIWDEEAKTISPDENLLYKELLLELSKLSPAYRTVFNLRAIDGYTFSEIAAMLGLTTGGAKATYFKAKQALQKNMDKLFNPQKKAC